MKQTNVMCGIVLCLALLTGSGFARDTNMPEFRPDGSIVLGHKSVRPDGVGRIIVKLDDKIFMAEQGIRVDGKWRSVHSFEGGTFEVDPSARRSVYSVDLSAVVRGASYLLETELQEDGLILIHSRCVIPENADGVVPASFTFSVPFDRMAGERVMADGQVYTFSGLDDPMPDEAIVRLFSRRGIERVTLFPFDAGTGLTVDVLSPTVVSLDERRSRQMAVFSLQHPPDGITFTLDIREQPKVLPEASEDTHAGIDFWRHNRLHVPRFDLSRNILPNPSFKAGMRYYQYFQGSQVPAREGYEQIYTLDDREAKFGQQSLAIRAIRDMRVPHDPIRDRGPTPQGWAYPQNLATFALPVYAGEEYTFSFHAKGNREHGLRMQFRGVDVNNRGVEFDGPQTVAITSEWQRYHAAFVPTQSGMVLVFEGRYDGDDPSGEGTIWIDGLQLERGALTDYTEKPLFSKLVTADPDNFLPTGVKLDARLSIQALPDTTGEVRVQVLDFHSEPVWEDVYGFASDEQGAASVALPLDASLGVGVYVVRADFTLDNGFEDRDFYRLSVMDFLENKHRNRTMHHLAVPRGSLRMRDFLERYQALGIGSTQTPLPTFQTYAPPPGSWGYDKYFYQLLNELGIKDTGATLVDDRKGNGRIIDGEGRVLIENLRDIGPEDLTPEFLERFESVVYEAVASMPWITGWKLLTEPNAEIRHPLSCMESHAQLHKAAFRGLKRANPDVAFKSPPSYNMNPSDGIRWVDEFMKAGGNEVPFDVISMHTYRQTPEDPDLDVDTATFLAMLDRHGFEDRPVYFEEGLWYRSLIVPAWGVTSHDGTGLGGRLYYLGFPSYHLGWGEKIAAAYVARSWLIGYKYEDRVRVVNAWLYNDIFMDWYLTPSLFAKVPNTLGHLLGDANFREDIRFAPRVRCYVFEDEQQRPVAAFWSHIPEVDHGNAEAPDIRVSFASTALEFIDLMGNPLNVEPDEQGTVVMSAKPFPAFVRGEPGTLEAFVDAWSGAQMLDAEIAPLQIAPTIQADGSVALALRNELTRPFTGTVHVNAAGSQRDHSVFLAPLESMQLVIPGSMAILPDQIGDVDLQVLVQEEGGAPIAVDASFHGFAVSKRQQPIAIDGYLDDWEGVPGIVIKNRSRPVEPGRETGHAALFRMAWDEEYLYLAVEVKDEEFVEIDHGHITRQWENDTLQVYIDTMADGRERDTRGFDANDYNYDFFPSADGSIVAYRRIAPGWQEAFLEQRVVEPNIRAAFRLVDGGYIYEIAFPQRYIVPMRLETGWVAGFSLTVNDHDGEELQSALVLTPEGYDSYMNPHLFPLILLTE